MKPNPKISAAVAAILSVPTTAIVLAAPADTTSATATGGELTEVVVTAERRTERLQDVPITVQAITGDQLKQLNVVSFNDLLKYTPNVTFSGNGPGTGNVFIRGLGGIGSGNQSQSTTAAFPNVALYLDDQSMQFPARNNDVYVVDMERIEVLEGPQGTLFGGGAQAGAIRYITNKPNLNATTLEASAGFGTTAHGTQNSNLSAVLNAPLIPDTLAIRAVIFSDHRGGYIDNLPATVGYLPGSIQTQPKSAGGGGNPTANNANVLGEATNPVTYSGLRLSALAKISDDWNVLVQQNYQDMRADGYFYTYPFASDGTQLGNYQIAAFTPAYTKDRYQSTAWTLNGKIGNLSAVYTGSYMSRHIEGQQDYSNYMRSVVGSYYGCIGPGAGYFNSANFPSLAGHSLQCYAPVGQWKDIVHNTHQSHELRISTDTESRFRALAGAFWEKFVINDNMNFNYLGIPQCNLANLIAATTGPLPSRVDCLSAVGPVPGSFASDPSLRQNINNAFGEDDQRGYKQTAVFASVDFDLIPKVLTLTGGVRHYKYNEFEHGSEWYSESTSSGFVVNHLNGQCMAQPGLCGFPINLDKDESGNRYRGNLTWHITPDIMAYYTFSQGFRPGAFNRTASLPGQPPSLHGEAPYCGSINGVQNAADPRCAPGGSLAGKNTDQFNKPAGYDSDNLINNEVGFKSEFLNHRLLFNLSAYTMKWKDEQLSLFDPVHLGNTTFNVNGPTYTIKGFEVQFIARIIDGLTVQGSSSINSPDQTVAPCLPSNRVSASNPTPVGQCVTVVKENTYLNPYGALHTRPAFAPPWMFNMRARYDWEAGGFKPFFWGGASHIGPMSNEPASFPLGSSLPPTTPGATPTTTLLRYDIPGTTTYDGALGMIKDNWTAQIQASNLTNVYGPSNISSGQFIKSEIPMRPRVIGLLLSYKF